MADCANLLGLARRNDEFLDRHISEDFCTLSIVQKAKRGEIQQYLKSKNGAREIDLCTELAAMLREFVGERRSGLPKEVWVSNCLGVQK